MLSIDAFVPQEVHNRAGDVIMFLRCELLNPEPPLDEQWEGVRAGLDMLQLVTLKVNIKNLLRAMNAQDMYLRDYFGSPTYTAMVCELAMAMLRVEDALEATNHFPTQEESW